MNKLKEILNNILEKENQWESLQSDMYLDSFFDEILSSVVNRIKKDAGNYDEINSVIKIKKDIARKTKIQYNIMISYCKDSEKSKAKEALKKYDVLLFLKFVIRILNIDQDYEAKVDECKKIFCKPNNRSIFQYLYDQNEVPLIKMKEVVETNETDLVQLYAQNSALISIRNENNMTIYSLSPKGRNLYAFFMMKHIEMENLNGDYNESKVNEVLEYLIEYILTQSAEERKKIDKPKLNSSSANYNLKKLAALLDKEKSYSSNFGTMPTNTETKSYSYTFGPKGGELKPWEIIY